MAPMTMWQVIRAKVMLTLLPVVVFTVLFSMVIAAASGTGIGQFAELVALVVWLSVGFVCIGVAAGGIDPHFEAKDDRRSVGVVGTLAAMAGSIGFGLLSVGALAAFVFGLAAAQGTARLIVLPSTPAVGALMFIGGLVLVAAASVVVIAMLWIANSRLIRYEGAIAE
jgi:hypothetical protein